MTTGLKKATRPPGQRAGYEVQEQSRSFPLLLAVMTNQSLSKLPPKAKKPGALVVACPLCVHRSILSGNRQVS